MNYSARHIMVATAALAAALATVPATAFLQTSPGNPGVELGVSAWKRGDFAGAVSQWRPLADKGDADAQFNMGQAYKLGRGVPADLRIAQSWYQKAAAQGHELAQANYGLLLYEAGKRAESMSWIRKAAARGDARAQYVLGIELTNGDLVPRDFPRAYALMTRSAAQGLPAASNSLREMEKFIPAADRQRGLALAEQMKSNPALVGTPSAPAPRVAGSNVRAAPKAATPAAKPPVAVAAATPKAAPAASAGGRWRAQLGAYGSQTAAAAQWAALAKRIGGMAGLRPSYEKAGALTRLRVGPLASRAQAEKLCASAKAAGQACFPVAP